MCDVTWFLQRCVFIPAMSLVMKAMETKHQCYVCLEPCNESDRSDCECRAYSHFQCLYDHAMINKSTVCTICKKEDKRFKDLKQLFLPAEEPQVYHHYGDESHARVRFFIFFVSINFCMFMFCSYDGRGGFILLPPIAYILMCSASFPMAIACSKTQRTAYDRQGSEYLDEYDSEHDSDYGSNNLPHDV